MKERIERLRRELGCTNRDLGTVIGVSAGTLSGYVTGRKKLPGWVVLRIAIIEGYLGLDPIKEAVVYPVCLLNKLQSIARETIAGVERLKQLDAMRRRAL